MSDYEELTDEEYAAEMGKAFFDGELQHLSGGKWVLREDSLYLEPLKGRRYRRKPNPRRITGHLAILPVHAKTDFTSLIYCFYATGEEIPEDTKSWILIPIDHEVPE
jgi:hypothetical protein